MGYGISYYNLYLIHLSAEVANAMPLNLIFYNLTPQFCRSRSAFKFLWKLISWKFLGGEVWRALGCKNYVNSRDVKILASHNPLILSTNPMERHPVCIFGSLEWEKISFVILIIQYCKRLKIFILSNGKFDVN